MPALAPLLGDKQTSGERVPNDAIDPLRTLGKRPARRAIACQRRRASNSEQFRTAQGARRPSCNRLNMRKLTKAAQRREGPECAWHVVNS
jgi:hypothetical protein